MNYGNICYLDFNNQDAGDLIQQYVCMCVMTAAEEAVHGEYVI